MAIAASATKSTGSGDNISLTPLTVDTSSGVSSSTADAKTIIVEGEEFDLTSPKARCDIQCQFCFEVCYVCVYGCYVLTSVLGCVYMFSSMRPTACSGLSCNLSVIPLLISRGFVMLAL